MLTAVLVVFAFVALIVSLVSFWRTKRTLERIEAMKAARPEWMDEQIRNWAISETKRGPRQGYPVAITKKDLPS